VARACRDDYHRADWMSASKHQHRESTIWPRHYRERQIRHDTHFAQHADYIHFNLMEHDHASHAKDWPYSTFHRYVKQGCYSSGWAAAEMPLLEWANSQTSAVHPSTLHPICQ
jgi:putative transposase